MPLIVVTIFFILLFSCEGLWYMFDQAHKENELRRYHDVEHPRKNRSDSYLDAF